MFLFSCKKENLNNPENTIPSNSFSGLNTLKSSPPNISDCYEGVSISNGILNFEDQVALLNCMDCLEEKTDIHISDFLDDYGHFFDSTLIVDTAFTFMVDSLNFDEKAVYKEFENHFSFNSLRSFMEAEIDEFIEGKADTDFTDFPTTFTVDEGFRAVFNEDRVIKVNDTIAYVNAPDEVYYFVNGSETLLDSFINNQVDTSHSKIFKNNTSNTCECFEFLAESDKFKDIKHVLTGTNWVVTHTMEHTKTSIFNIETFVAKSRAYGINSLHPILNGKMNANFTLQLQGFGYEYAKNRNDCSATSVDLNTKPKPNNAVQEGRVRKVITANLRVHTWMKQNKLLSKHEIGTQIDPNWYYECPH